MAALTGVKSRAAGTRRTTPGRRGANPKPCTLLCAAWMVSWDMCLECLVAALTCMEVRCWYLSGYSWQARGLLGRPGFS